MVLFMPADGNFLCHHLKVLLMMTKRFPWELYIKGTELCLSRKLLLEVILFMNPKLSSVKKCEGSRACIRFSGCFGICSFRENLSCGLSFLSHGVGPVAVPLFLLLLFLSNFALYSIYPYNLFFILQLLFYITSAIGFISHRLSLQIPLVHLTYFIVINIVASLVGFCAFILKSQKPTWKKVS